MRRHKSPTQKIIEHLIYQPTKRTRSKRKPVPTASEVVTYDHCYQLLQAEWNRMRKTR